MNTSNIKQRHHHHRRRPMRPITAAACLVLCLLASTAGAADVTSEAHPLTRGGGPCIKGKGNTSCSPLDSKDELIHWTNDGKLFLRSETYSGDSAGYGQQIFQILGKIEKGSRLLDHLELEVRSDAGKDAIRTLIDELISLASAHEDKWGELRQVDHFNKAINALETASDLYTRVWKIMEQGGGINSSIFSIYDREAMSTGLSHAYLSLFGLYRQRCSMDATSKYCALAYNSIFEANDWSDESLMVLGIDVDGDRNVAEVANAKPDTTEYAMHAHGSIQLLIGVFLIDRYTSGHVLDGEGKLSFQPKSYEINGGDEKKQLSEEQMRILSLSLVHSAIGQIIYTELATDDQGYMPLLASTCNYLGLAFRFLQEWVSATEQYQMTVSLYEDLLVSFKSKRVPESLDIAARMSEAAEGLWGAYVHRPGKTEEAKKAFLEYIDTQRFVESQIPLHEPLSDEEEDDEESERNRDDEHLTKRKSKHDDKLQTYQTRLDEYLHQDIVLRVDYASYSHTNHAYEGGLRASIGAIYSYQERNFEAVDELELAIELLRASDSDGDKRIQVEVARALMSLANANVGLRKWKSGYDAFEEALDIFASELGEGETPMINACTGLSLDNMDCTSDDGEDTADDKEEEEEESNVDISWGDYVKVENFEIVDDNNTTSTMVGASYSI